MTVQRDVCSLVTILSVKPSSESDLRGGEFRCGMANPVVMHQWDCGEHIETKVDASLREKPSQNKTIVYGMVRFDPLRTRFEIRIGDRFEDVTSESIILHLNQIRLLQFAQ